MHLHLGYAEARDEAELGRAEHAAGLEDPLAGRHVFTGLADVLAPLSRLEDEHVAVFLLGDLDLHDRIGPLRDRRPGHDLRRLFGFDDPSADSAGRDDQRDLETHGRVGPGVDRVDGPHGKAIHARVVERRHVVGSGYLLGENPAQSPWQSAALCRQWGCFGENSTPSFFNADEFLHSACKPFGDFSR